MKLTVKNLKSMNGRDGLCWSCTLYIDGVKAAYVIDQGFGGPIDFDWYDKSLESKFKTYVDGLPTDKSEENVAIWGPEGYKKDMGAVVCQLADELENQKKLKSACRTGTYFRLKGDKIDSWRTVKVKGKNHPFTPQIKDWIVRTYGEQLEEILNEKVA